MENADLIAPNVDDVTGKQVNYFSKYSLQEGKGLFFALWPSFHISVHAHLKLCNCLYCRNSSTSPVQIKAEIRIHVSMRIIDMQLIK